MKGYSKERWDELNSGGNFKEYCREIATETGVETSEVVKTFPKYTKLLTELQMYMMTRYYLMGKSKIQIQYELGKASVRDVEKCLERADKNLKQIYRSLSKED